MYYKNSGKAITKDTTQKRYARLNVSKKIIGKIVIYLITRNNAEIN